MKRWIVLSLLCCHGLYLCTSHAIVQKQEEVVTNRIDPDSIIEQSLSLLEEGDLVVRMHKDPTSNYIRAFNRNDKSYSHAGIVLFEKGYPYIYHITNKSGEEDDLVKKEPLSQFCSQRRNEAYGIYRYNLSATEKNQLKGIMNGYIKNEVRFDERFDRSTNDKMYCSEMIAKLLAKATSGRILIRGTKPNIIEAGCFASYAKLPFDHVKGLEIIAMDNLYTLPSCRMVQSISFRVNRPVK